MVPASILVVDDDPRICDLLRRYLEDQGYSVQTASDGTEMHGKLSISAPDLVILDLMLPGEDGLTLALQLRNRGDMGIIMLSGKKIEAMDKIVGLEVGADDYITKPFDDRELLARVRSVLRRRQRDLDTQPVCSDPCVAHFEGWTLDLVSHELTSPSGKSVELTSHEFRLVSVLVRNANRVLSRDRILELITDRDWTPGDRSVDVLVGKLRKKLSDNSHSCEFIKTVRFEGYQFAARVEFNIAREP